MIRKIVRVGASLCILLPKEVIKKMDWDFNDHIDLILDEEQEKIVLRNLRKKEKKSTELANFDIFLNEYQEVLQALEN